MRKLLALAALLLSMGIAAAQETFPAYVGGLPTAATLNAGDVLYVLQSGVSKQLPGSALFAGGAITLGGTVVPLGSTAGTVSSPISGLYLTSPNLGTPAAATLTNATNLPISTGVSGLGTGVAAALGNTAGGTGGFALQSSLGSYLPLAGGTMSGNIAMGGGNISGGGTFTATTLAGTLSTAAQTNVTSLGTLTGLTIGAGSSITSSGPGGALASGAFAAAYVLPIATASVLGGVKPDGITITINAGTGVITAVGASATSVDLGGATSISNGTSNALVFDSAGNLGKITVVNSAVLVTSSGGVPSESTTLPSGLAATNMALTTPAVGVATGTSLALNGCTLSANAFCATGTAAISSTLTSAAHAITSASANALVAGLNGATNPAFNVDASTSSQAAGLNIKGAATGGTVAISLIDSGSNTNLTINAKGSGTIGIGSVSTGVVTITPATTITGALTLTGGLNTPLVLAQGGTAAALTASNGGIVYSTASALAILAGTGTANLCLLSGANTTPSWGSCSGSSGVTGPSSATSGDIASFNGTSGGVIQDSGVNITSGGTISIPTGQAYQINGTSVLNATTLGTGVTASSLTSVGALVTGTKVSVASGAAEFVINSASAQTPYISFQQATTEKWEVGVNVVNAGRLELYNTTNTAVVLGLGPTGIVYMPGLAGAQETDILCYNTSTGEVTYATTVAGCTGSSLDIKVPRGTIDPEHALAALTTLVDPAIYSYKPTANEYNNGKVYAGLYAQQMCAVDELLCEKKDGKITNYDKIGTAAYTIAALKQLKHEFDQYRAEHP